MGAFLDKPNTEVHSSFGDGNGLRFGVSSMQGWRVEMEDAHLTDIGLPGSLKDWSAFAVFDGHAGGQVSEYCAKNLIDAIISNDDFPSSHISAGESNAPSIEVLRAALRTGFLQIDENLRKRPATISGEDSSGSTAVCTFLTPSHIVFANCGDSRAVLSRGGKMVSATVDHKPSNPGELTRIEKAGGSVMMQRINGSLAVSRALGDFDYKNVTGRKPCEQLVSPEPELTVVERNDDDEFLALACDGIWDVMSNDELCDFIRNRMQVTNDLCVICTSVLNTCLAKGSRDNMSIIIVTFKGAPQVSETVRAKDCEINAEIEAKVAGIVRSSQLPPDSDMSSYILQVLSSEDIEGLPPGGGIYAKNDIIESAVNKLSSTSTTSNNHKA